MARASIARRHGLPANARTHPDPAIRRAYRRAQAAERRARNPPQASTSTVCGVRIGGATCSGTLIFGTDQLGRVTSHCPSCARRRAGVCAECPKPVTGTVGRALRCAGCKRTRNNTLALDCYFRYHDANLEAGREKRRKERKRKYGHEEPLPREERGRRGGLVSGPRQFGAMPKVRLRKIASRGGRAAAPTLKRKGPEYFRALGKRGADARWGATGSRSSGPPSAQAARR